MDLLLVHPPAVKPAEPPLGTAILLGSLRRQGLHVGALDANLEAYLYLLDPERLRAIAGPHPPTPLRRALIHLPRSVALLRSPAAADSFSRYGTAVSHLEAALGGWGQDGERLSLGDYVHPGLSEFDPADLERVASGDVSTLFSPFFSSELLPRIGDIGPRTIALSIHYRHQVLPAFELAGLLKRRLPGIKIVAGGGMITSWRDALRGNNLRFSVFDALVFGPGEAPLLEIASEEAGEYFREGRETVSFHPDFSFARMSEYFSPVPALPVSASRGCYWRRCLFCPEAVAPTHPHRVLPPGEFPALLKELSLRYGVRHFHLTDNAVPLPALAALAGGGKELEGIGWHGFVRFESPLTDPEFVRGLAAGGCRMLQLGLESGSPAVLQRLRKGTSPDVAARVLKNLREAGIASYVYVMLGTPGETQCDAEATLAFLERHADCIGFLNLSIMNLPRDSEMTADPARFGIAGMQRLPEEEPLGLYRSFTSLQGWGRAEARRFLQRRLLGSPAIRAIVRRTPPAFTSNHAFLFR